MSIVSTSAGLLAQWTNPGGLAALAMVLGGDIVHGALAQSSGTRFTPACFSFGSVAYAFTALSAVFDNGRLLPVPKSPPVKVFNLSIGTMRINQSWTVGRIQRDLEIRVSRQYPMFYSDGIRITVFDAVVKEDKSQHTAHHLPYNLVHMIGFVVALVQLGIAAIPWALKGREGNWIIFLITASAISLGSLFASLPQWTAEKLPGQRNSDSVFALTRGRGFKDIVVIRGASLGLDLDELAATDLSRSWRSLLRRRVPSARGRTWTWRSTTTGKDSNLCPDKPVRGLHREPTMKRRTVLGEPLQLWVTRAAAFVHALLWLLVLAAISGLKSDLWYLLGIGALGMVVNLVIGALEIPFSARFLALEPRDIIIQRWPMDGIMDLESSYRCGRPLLDEFFGNLTRDEEMWWSGDEKGKAAYDGRRQRDLDVRGIPRSRQPNYDALMLPTFGKPVGSARVATTERPPTPELAPAGPGASGATGKIRPPSPAWALPPPTAGQKLGTVLEGVENGEDPAGGGNGNKSAPSSLANPFEHEPEDVELGPGWG